MNGLDNAQGNYNQGRGRDGLGFVGPYYSSRFGTGVPMGNRPGHVTGKPRPPASLDPAQVLPTKSAGLIDPSQLPGQVRIVTPMLKRRIHPMPRRRSKPNKAKKIRNRQAFINWIKNWAPQVYVAAKAKADRIEARDGTLGQLGGWWETFSESVSDLGGKYLQFRTQKEILEAQLERMRAGLPPLQTSEYAPTIAIKPDPGTTREITGAIGAGFGKMFPFIAIAVVGGLLLMRRRR